ncbi:cupin domain-containing protein [Coniochaeta ligniaria NRRL 30616]|uniref:Cupin domain-containing protein n=1 Tax=Coniochaeta ligniaria NRRL 30616 TaxID=1408157 RepID=A0A1J7JA34_9PEZI|nr:cupin domain-containing protein [Coniochaeta ligniaria NRRL 30616]
MPIPLLTTPPPARTTYIIDQLEGERLSIPGSKGAFRILASSKQTAGGIAVFQSGAVLSDAPGFHWHAEAHDVFYVVKGYLKLWNGDKCRVMGPGDFAYVPPKVIHNPQLLGPYTETLGLIAPGDWIDFFRYIAEPFDGNILPEFDGRDLASILIPKVMAAKDQFDVNFVRPGSGEYTPPEVGEWLDSENVLPGPGEPYFLRANTGPRWLLGGVLVRPFINASQCGGRFGIASIEGSGAYSKDSSPLGRSLAFPTVDHCFVVFEGVLEVKLEGEEGWSAVREGQTLVVAAGQGFALGFGSRYVRAVLFTNGCGIEELIQTAGEPFEGFVLPDEPGSWDEGRFLEAAGRLGVLVDGKVVG